MTLVQPLDNGRCAPPKALGIRLANKNHLQKLIKKGKVDITKTANGAYINQVRFNHFRHRKTYNFRRNFRSYARSRELEDHLSGYLQEQGGGKVSIFLFNLCYYII